MSDNTRLITMFDLDREVEAFVKARVRDLCGKHRHDFHFSGSNHTNICKIDQPHIPHIRSTYHTVRYGELDHFCTGKQGATPEGELVIVVEKSSPGSPEYPAKAHGYWFIKEEVST